jgi:alkylation response protein AidB-like acyl-CoA dehydrogenase
MKRIIQLSTLQAKQRVQFGKPISEFGLIKQKVGQMVVDCYATEAVVSMVASLNDRGFSEYQVEAAISKVFASECLWRTVDEGLQIAAGNGYMAEYPYERAMRDSRINRIFEGTNDVLRLFIALTAMNDVGQELRELAGSLKGAFNDPIKGFGVISEYALRRAALATGIKREGTSFTKLHPTLTPVTAMFEEQTRDLATATDRILRKHGRNIIDKQLATRRLADIMIDLFVRASILWDEQGASATFKAALGSVISALLAYALMSNTLLSHLIVTFPELLLIVLALMLLMGRYNGYKLSEFYRFRKFKGVRS